MDAAFQAVIVWIHQQTGHHSLPTGFKTYRQHAAFPKNGSVTLRAKVISQSAHQVVSDLYWLDADGRVIAEMCGYEMVVDAKLKGAFDRNQLSSQEC